MLVLEVVKLCQNGVFGMGVSYCNTDLMLSERVYTLIQMIDSVHGGSHLQRTPT